MSRPSLLPVALCFLLAACGPSAADHEAAFRSMEERLLTADSVRFDFEVTAEGLLEADLRGSAVAVPEGTIRLEAAGSFIGREIQMSLRSTADSLFMETNEMSDSVERPAETYAAIILGLTRMGILHNLATLSTVSPPEHAGGGMSEWVTVTGFESGAVAELEGMAFDVMVEGERTSGAILVLEDGLPAARRQQVDFPGGAMIVNERYSNFTVFE